jgi:hypothetical protein
LVVIGVENIDERPRVSSSRALLNTGESPSSVTERGTEPTRVTIGAGSGA